MQQRAQVEGPFDAEPHVQEAPRLGAGHVLARQTVKRGQADQRFIQDRHGVPGNGAKDGGKRAGLGLLHAQQQQGG